MHEFSGAVRGGAAGFEPPVKRKTKILRLLA